MHPFTLRSCLTPFVVAVALPLSAAAEPPPYPAWWSAAMKSNPVRDDYAAINQGQSKNLALKAFMETYLYLPSTQRQALETHLNKFTEIETPVVLINGIPKRKPKTSLGTDDYAVVNLGQLKAMAKPFYQVFQQLGWQKAFPWPVKGASDNYAMANIGQAKQLFFFEFLGDADGDGVPNVVENKQGTNPGMTDSDYDGNSDSAEAMAGTDPNKRDHPEVRLTAFGFTNP